MASKKKTTAKAKAAAPDFNGVFDALRPILAKYAKRLVVTQDADTAFQLNTAKTMDNGNAWYFGGAVIKKNYVSFHLFPVYTDTDLLDDVSAALMGRMQGKSCFNFETVDPALFKELAALTKRGFDRYVRAGRV